MKEMKRILSLVLVLVMLVGVLPANAFAATSDTQYIMLGSDRHGETDVIPGLLGQMEATIDGDNMIDYVGLLGDMVNSTNSYDTADLLDEVNEVETHLTAGEVDVVYAAHDKGTVTDANGMLNKTSGRWYTGDNFYIYGVIQDDVQNTSSASTAASNFIGWVNGLEADDDRVIIVTSHFPLHDMRNDNKGAYYWHQALNTAATGAASGDSTVERNVLFFHGHNHTEDSTEYFYQVGEEMSIENNGSTATEPIYYTYATAGYMLTDRNTGAKGGNGHGTLLAISDDTITLSRYDYSSGLITSTDNYAYDTDGYAEVARVVTETAVTEKTFYPEDEAVPFAALTATATSGTVTNIYDENNTTANALLSFWYGYDFSLEGQVADTSATITLWLDADGGMTSDNLAIYYLNEETGEYVALSADAYSVAKDEYNVEYITIKNAALGTYVYGTPNTDDAIPEGAALDSISVVAPTKTAYFDTDAEDKEIDGETKQVISLDITGMKVTANYVLDGEVYSKTLTWNQFDGSIDGYALTFAGLQAGDYGEKTVTVSYGGKSETFTIWICAEAAEAGDASFTFSDPCVVSIAVEPAEVTTDISAFIVDYVAYNIQPTYANGMDALTGTANVTLPRNGLVNPAVYYVTEYGYTERMPIVEMTDTTVTFQTTHFSTFAMGEENVTEWKELPSTSYVLDEDGVDAGGQYLIVAPSVAYAMTNSINRNAASRYAVTFSDDDETTIVVDATLADYLWTFSGSTSGTIKDVDGDALYRSSSTNLSTSGSNSTTWTISDSDDGTYNIYYKGNQSSYYLRYNSSSFSLSSSPNTVRLYKYTAGVGGYAGIAGGTEFTVDLNTAEENALNIVKAGIAGYYKATEDGTASDITDDLVYTWVDTYDGTTVDSYTLSVSYQGTQLGTVEVKVAEREAAAIAADTKVGNVRINAGTSATVGITLTVTYADNTTAEIPVTVGMLTDADGNAISTATQGTLHDLTITYGGETITGVELNINPTAGNNYPQYPKEGAVRVNKTGDGTETDFQTTGVTKVELSTTGVPYQGNGIDVILVLDWTSSMDDNTVGTGSEDRMDKTVEATRAFLKEIMIDTEGNLTGNNILLYAFESGKTWQIKLNSSTGNNAFETITESMISDLDGDTVWEKMDTFLTSAITRTQIGSSDYTVSSSTPTPPSNATEVDGGGASSSNTGGTTYGVALAAVYDKFGNTTYAEGEERGQYCVFMSDGAPTKLDYYGIVSESPNASTGAWTYTYDKYAATNIITWVDPTTGNTADGVTFTTSIKPELWSAMTRRDYGVTFFSVGLGVDKSDNVTGYTSLSDDAYYALTSAILGSIASAPTADIPQTLFTVTDEAAGTDGLANAFQNIAASIKQAGTNAYFVDTMGDNFDLQMSTTLTDSEGNSYSIPSTDITVTSYDLITRSQIGTTVTLNGVSTTITEQHVGMRVGTSTVLETVSFRDGGAYSTAVDNGATDILVDGVICAANFWYNTNSTAKMIDTDGDGTAEYSLAPETFYWKIGTISEKEIALSYYVYLTGVMEGKREAADSYETNKSAILYYTNYLGNTCHKDTISPTMPWKSATVSYAFYLVDATTGLPITNITTGATGSFADAVKVTSPIVYETVLLNSGSDLTAIKASDVLLEGYELFDAAAEYDVYVSSSDANSNWQVTKGTDQATTYVTNYGGEPTTTLMEDDDGYEYTNTIVYFAVKFQIQTLKDAVVVDYGLPVDITVMANDFFGNNGKLIGVLDAIPDSVENDKVGTANFIDPDDITDAQKGSTSYTATYGTAALNVVNDESFLETYVRYTPTTMEFNGVDTFAYCVAYNDPDTDDAIFGDVTGYYYGEVTVIPATTVYYEDSFTTSAGDSYITYAKYEKNDEGTLEEVEDGWTTEGTPISSATQAEDRPGKYSMVTIDANNVYGYDGAYSSMSSFSLGSAKKVHVDANSYATASFEFYGTGLDIISMTSNTTGTMILRIYKDNTVIAAKTVDTYYGYMQDSEGNWVVDPSASDSLYQIPVLKVDLAELGYDYGQYRAELSISYFAVYDHTTADGYDFYLDAIRIYNPAGDGSDVAYTNNGNNVTIADVYAMDGEGWPTYTELRNLVIDANDFNAADDGEQAEGIIFIDNTADTTYGVDYTISDYTSYGPNNELYLAPGQSVAFELDLSSYIVDSASIVADVQLGVKSADGSQVEVTMQTDTTTAPRTFNTATDMYYSFAALLDRGTSADNTASDSKTTVVLSNSGDKGIVSITNIKVTFTEEPVVAVPAMLTFSRSTGETALMMLSAAADEEFVPEETEPETTVPEETEPETTVPEETEPETTVPEETEPETTVPEETVPEETIPEEDPVQELVSNVKKVVNTIVNALSNLFGRWFR